MSIDCSGAQSKIGQAISWCLVSTQLVELKKTKIKKMACKF